MNPFLRVFRNAAAPALAALVLTTPASSAHAITVNIDQSQSSVTYTPGGVTVCDPQGNCSEPSAPQTFALSGSFNVKHETVFVTTSFFPPAGYDREQVQFDAIAIDSGGAEALGFSFPTYLAVLSGQAFSGNEDPCTWFPSTGACFSMGWFGDFSGTFDGTTLSMSGSDYAGDFFPSTFSFNVVARALQVANVPEPGTLACLVGAALGMGATARRRRNLRSRASC